MRLQGKLGIYIKCSMYAICIYNISLDSLYTHAGDKFIDAKAVCMILKCLSLYILFLIFIYFILCVHRSSAAGSSGRWKLCNGFCVSH